MVTGELTLDAEITKYPIEQGADLTDHIRPLPPSIALEAIVSDTPVGDIANHETRRIDEVSAAVFGSDMIPLPSAEAYERLEAIHSQSRLVTIEIPVASRSGKTGKRTFINMALAHLSIPLEFEGGLKFSAEFARVNVAVNKRVTVRTATPSGKPKSKAKVAVGTAYRVDARILWEMGHPPGSNIDRDKPYPWAIVEVTRPTGGATTGPQRGAGNVYRFSGENRLYDSGTAGRSLTEEELSAYLADLGNAKRQKIHDQLKLNDLNAQHAIERNENRSPGTGPGNLPPGLDLSRFDKSAPANTDAGDLKNAAGDPPDLSKFGRNLPPTIGGS